ncbi:MAG: exo-alpha-sialidase [Planctomycetes bacterium]|nr:exo-alpha-sialidase [Planctomycetota bacterium]MBL7041734.1 exo-alpha-sialidase [Pirellulaceae bacterium]
MKRSLFSSLVMAFCATASGIGAENAAPKRGEETISEARAAETVTNKRFAYEQEGFARALSVSEDQVPVCGTAFWASSFTLRDFRGATPNSKGTAGRLSPHLNRTFVEWETTAAETGNTTVFTWIGGSRLRPVRPAFPIPMAKLFVDGTFRLRFPLGRTIDSRVVSEDGFSLRIEPRRFQSLVERSHRTWQPDGVSGFYRLKVPGKFLKVGQPLRLRVELEATPPDCETLFFVSPRRDALRVDLRLLRDEVAQLQADVTQLRESHQMLYTQLYPQLFPRLVPGEVVVAMQDETSHLHPPSITAMANGELVITCREATDHLAPDGRIVIVRSSDGGKTWGPREVILDGDNVDHRAAPILELPCGDWVALDYRAGGLYSEDGAFGVDQPRSATLWGAWSEDRGKTWSYSAKPLTVPEAANLYAEVERPPVILPSGRLLVGANYRPTTATKTTSVGIAIFSSDDNGRSWQVLSRVPPRPFIVGEAALLRTDSGKILLLSRSQEFMDGRAEATGSVMQSVSLDNGKTWSELREVGMSSMNTPAHLLQMKDGRILCTHASRHYPRSVYATVSRDEGETWDTPNTRIITNDLTNNDTTYPTTAQLADGTLVTTWYANLFGKFFVAVKRYRPEDL